ncbi:hypothetical protein [Azorhizobium doebereinerae]|uniref:hypothetical protein n=1 Tax=Azorhizobium doebereinerae TaxID=281091 RepID=UPI000409DC31|nr:hypothetical protein [Azorhizobium doebereinerae]
MKKVVVAVVVLAVVGIGGYFGFTRYVQVRAKGDVEAVFATLRQQGAEARYQDVSFDLSGRVLTVTGIDVSAPGAGQFKADRLVARGITSPSGGAIQASAVELEGLVLSATGLVAPGVTVSYAVPKARIDNYQGPDRLLPVAPGNGSHPYLREMLVRFAAVRADSLTVPQLTGRMLPAPGTPADGAIQPVELAYEGFKASGIADGRVAEVTLDRVTFTTKVVTDGKAEPAGGEMANLRASGIDTGPVRALTDAEPRATSPLPVYARITAGPYVLKPEPGHSVRVGTIAIDRVAINPVDLSFRRLDEMSALAQRGTPLSADETARLLTLTADTLDGFAVGAATFGDMTVTDKNGTATVAALTFQGFANGKLDSLELTGLAGTTKDLKPVSIKRAAIQGFSFHDLLRISAETAKNDNMPSLDTGFGLFKVLSGLELEGIVAPHEEGGGTVSIQAMSLSWGDFAGALPTRLAFKADKVSGPISAEDGEPFSYLAAAGLKQASISMQLNLAYDPAARTLTLSPASTEVDQAFALRVEARLDNVPKTAFEDPAGAFLALGEATAGPVTLTVTNLGLAQIMLKQQADLAGVEPEDLKAELISGVKTAARDAAQVVPDAAVIGDAVAAFLQSPGTLTLTLTPRTPMPVLQLVGLDNPLEALIAFKVTATAAP